MSDTEREAAIMWLKERFFDAGLDKHYAGYGEGGDIDMCARIAADFAEEARLDAVRRLVRLLRQNVRGDLELCQISRELLDSWIEDDTALLRVIGVLPWAAAIEAMEKEKE